MIKVILILSLFTIGNVMGDTVLTASGGAYDFELTTEEKTTGDDVKLFNDFYSISIDSKYGGLSFEKTVEYENTNFQRINYKSSPLMYSFDSTLAVIFLPSFDLKDYSEINRSFKESTVSTWFGLLSYRQKEDSVNGANIKSTRYGLTTSLFSEEMRYFMAYGYNNPDEAIKFSNRISNITDTESTIDDKCKASFYYVNGSVFCQKNKLNFYAYYGLAYDYYKIDAESDSLGDGSGTGFLYGINTFFEVRYEMFKNNNIALGLDVSYYQGTESISFSNSEIDDDITKFNSNVSIKYNAKF